MSISRYPDLEEPEVPQAELLELRPIFKLEKPRGCSGNVKIVMDWSLDQQERIIPVETCFS